MSKSISMLFAAAAMASLVGCASVPMTSDKAALDEAKSFPVPPEGKAGVYVFRNSFVGQALKKDVWVDGECLGATQNKVFFYTLVDGDSEHKFSTESEFSPNDLLLPTEAGKNYFVQQEIKMGVFVGGAKLSVVSEAEGRKQVAALKMAEKGQCSK